jgi:glycosyltransferase involved in cell wall biosynthesis
MTLSVCIITLNEEANIVRTLQSVKDIADEIVVVDSGSTDATVSLAKGFGAKVFVEPWKGFARQKNSSLEKAGGQHQGAFDIGQRATICRLHDEPPQYVLRQVDQAQRLLS